MLWSPYLSPSATLRVRTLGQEMLTALLQAAKARMRQL
jgi:hypothetical protein